MTDPTALTAALGGIATRQQLLAAGCTGFDLTRGVRSGRIMRLRQARYAISDASEDAALAARVGGMLAGSSAADSYGLWSGTDSRLHISVGTNSARLRTNVSPRFGREQEVLSPDTSARRIVVHWLVGGAVPELGPECWRVPLDVCLRQVVAWSDRENSIACLDTARTIARLTTADLLSMFARAASSDRLTVSASRSGSESGPESLVRQRLARIGVEFRQQISIPNIGRVDFGLTGTRIVIEVDSRKHHDDSDSFERDRWRDAELVARGFTVIRLTYRRIMRDWPWCESVVLAALAASH